METVQVEQYRMYLYRFILQSVGNVEDAEELTNTACFNACRGNYMPTHKFTTWLLSIARNVLKDFYRRRSTQARIPSDKIDDIDEVYGLLTTAHGTNPYKILEQKDNLRIIHNAIDALPRRQSQILYKRFIEQMKIGDIATELGISVGATKASLFNGKRKLKVQLQECGIISELSDVAV